MKKLAIVVTHPIQYYVPMFQLLSKKCDLKVFYTWGEQGAEAKYDPGFNKIINWDISMLEGYNYEFLTNVSSKPGSHHFNGIKNSDLVNKIIEFNPNAILVYGWAYASHLKVLRKFKGIIPIWFRGDSTLLDDNKGLESILRKLFLKWVYSHVDKAFYVGLANKKYFENFGLKPEQLVFAPHAVDNDRFAQDRSYEAEQVRTSLNINGEDILILFAGKLETKKNPELLLEAFLEMLKESEDRRQKSETIKNSTLVDQTSSSSGNIRRTGVHLLFVGNGELEESLKLRHRHPFGKSLATNDVLRQAQDDISEEANAKGENSHLTSHVSHLISKNIHFMDFQNQTQMPVIYQACDLFCLPSIGPGETWGLSINEAMAAKCAILTTEKVGCSIDIVKDGVNGYIFKAGNLADILKYLNKMKNKTLLSEMGKNSTEIICNYTFKNQVDVYISALQFTDKKR